MADRKHGPWTIKASSQKYKNQWIEVTEDEVIRPDGEPGIFATVKMRGGVSVLAMDEEGMVYLTSEYRYAYGAQSIEVVSGGLDEGETPLDAAQRELREELGFEASEWIDLGIISPFTSVIYSPAALFLARGLKPLQAEHEGTEIIEIFKVDFEEAVQMVMDSRIVHAPSCVLILKAKGYLNSCSS